MKYLAWATFLLAACTVSNPLYTGGDGGSIGTPDFSGVHDGGTGHDLPMPPRDFTVPGSCTDGDRKCEGTKSQICQGGTFKTDRACPSGSTCTGGFCQPPMMSLNGTGTGCSVDTGGGPQPLENACFQGGGTTNSLSCQPFVDAAGGVTWVCDAPVGTGLPGTMCTEGGQCRSGFCGSNGTCFRGCASSQDCPRDNTGQQLQCTTVTITVEGVTVMAQSCTP